MLYLHKGEDMNRIEKRNIIHKFNRTKGLKKKKTKGAFGKINDFIGCYKSLKVIPLHKRTEVHNQFGVVKYSK